LEEETAVSIVETDPEAVSSAVVLLETEELNGK
jgi:hypothetical protein